MNFGMYKRYLNDPDYAKRWAAENQRRYMGAKKAEEEAKPEPVLSHNQQKKLKKQAKAIKRSQQYKSKQMASTVDDEEIKNQYNKNLQQEIMKQKAAKKQEQQQKIKQQQKQQPQESQKKERVRIQKQENKVEAAADGKNNAKMPEDSSKMAKKQPKEESIKNIDRSDYLAEMDQHSESADFADDHQPVAAANRFKNLIDDHSSDDDFYGEEQLEEEYYEEMLQEGEAADYQPQSQQQKSFDLREFDQMPELNDLPSGKAAVESHDMQPQEKI